ncbi:NADPH oxidase activator 1 [Bombina bombina]|uniref:NADPH oxidase activator 1 n=1 Tax=Bombina bombina TaxID=8345 RepID=UPI00235AD4E5|nr:NADPH oxidase activator 1 [Bombina bombina]
MPYKDLIKCWHEGVLAAEKKDFDLALKIFTGINDLPSKLWFNIGCIHLLKGELLQALAAYDESVTKDSRLAVGYFQRGYVNFKLERYEKALSDCHLALANLRNNSVIDYKQLGLRYQLYAWEVLYNSAAILSHLGRWESVSIKLKEALFWLPTETRNEKIMTALDLVEKQQVLMPCHIPDGEMFRPRKQEVDQLKSLNFLGKPKVITSVVPNDDYSGFEPLRPQKPGFYEPCPEAVLGRDAGYHRVLAHYYPENSNEVAVKANSLLFVLNKNGDWATAIHDGKKLLIPTNFLEPANPPKADMKKLNNGLPLPPMKVPPARPNARTAEEALDPLQQEIPTPGHKELLPHPTGDSPLPIKVKPFTSRAEVIVDISVPLQSSSADQQERKNEPTEAEPLVEVGASTGKEEGSAEQVKRNPALSDVSPASESDDIVLQVHTEFTVAMTVRKNITYPELQNLLRTKLKQQGDQMDIKLSYKNMDGKGLIPVQDDVGLQGMWQQAKENHLMLCCKGAERCIGRPILYRVEAVYDYSAEGREDLTFVQGNTIDILSEVNDEWLEGHCNGSIGIFPKCFVSKLTDNQKEERT